MDMLRMEQVVAGYGKAQVLHGIDLFIAPGEVVALVGPNGAGKTTTIRCITGEVTPRSGRVFYREEDLEGKTSHAVVARGISCSPEGRHIFGNLTVQENLQVGGYLLASRKKIRERIRWVCDLFPKLWERRGQLAESLSGGEQQMLAIGRAIMNEPRLLLLDEPSLGLAPIIVDQIYERIGEISREGVAILLVEQNVGLALEISSRTYVMESGEIRLEGKSADLEHNSYVVNTYLGVK